MNEAIYIADSADALASLREVGTEVQVFALSTGAYSIVSDTKQTPTVRQEHTFIGLNLPIGRTAQQALRGDNQLTEMLIAGKLRYFLLGASGAPFAPEPNMVLFFNNSYFRIEGTIPLSPVGVDLLYRVFTSEGTQDFFLSGTTNQGLLAESGQSLTNEGGEHLLQN